MISESQIEDAAARIDAHLAKEGIPIHARPLRAATLIGKELGITGFQLLNDQPSASWKTDNSHVWPVLNRWYERQYGERLKHDMSFGKVALLLRGATWACEIPYMIGSVRIYAQRDGIDTVPMEPRERMRSINVFECVEGLTPELQSGLTDVEVQGILEPFKLGCEAFTALHQAARHELLDAAKKDFAAAVDHLTKRPHYGQSRWASLQGAEKVVKHHLDAQGVTFPKTHDLAKLSTLLASVGLPPMTPSLIKAVQCQADVRYDDSTSTLQEALDAHYGSLSIVSLYSPRKYVRPAPPGKT